MKLQKTLGLVLALDAAVGPTPVLAGSPVSLSDEEIATVHRSVQDRSCAGFHITGSGNYRLLDVIDMTISAHICSQDDASDRSASKVVGKVFATSEMDGISGTQLLFHAHCMHVDEQGGAYIGAELEDMDGSLAEHMYDPSDNNRRLKKMGKMAKGKAHIGVELEDMDGVLAEHMYDPSDNNRRLKKMGKKSSKKSSKKDVCPIRRALEEAQTPLWDAGEEITSGKEPKGSLAIWYFQRKEDQEHPGSKHRVGADLHAKFDTSCVDFAEMVKLSAMNERVKLSAVDEHQANHRIEGLSNGEIVFNE
jgi:hypothetical protein